MHFPCTQPRLAGVLHSIVLSGLCLLPTACGKKYGPVNPVSGQVFVNGQPATNATVIFYPQNQGEAKAYPNAIVEADGSFKLTTFNKEDGAPEGEYTVTIVWSDSRREEGETIEGPDKLQGRFATAANSTLKATVKKGKNQLPRFDLN
jgi:hypothetical protein